MGTASTLTASIVGVDAHIINVECDISLATSYFSIVGLPDNEVKESRERVTSAINNSVGEFPIARVIVNLSPANIKKQGTGFDLPIAISIIASNNMINKERLRNVLVVGELSLEGHLKEIPGILSIAIEAAKQGVPYIIVPQENAEEASLVDGIRVFSAANLQELFNAFTDRGKLTEHPHNLPKIEVDQLENLDFSDVKGHQKAKRALEIAAAGGHNLLFCGSPGSGKTMLAKRLVSILPSLGTLEMLDVTRIHSVTGKSGKKNDNRWKRPFREPHHSISNAGLIGGGTFPKPGEVSLAHKGVLFLDELPEFSRSTLELLRQPIEDKWVHIARANMTLSFPADFQLIAAMNPCPCGFYGDRRKKCKCSIPQIKKYLAKLSGPLLDRIDIQIELPNLNYEEMNFMEKGESSNDIRKRVIRARQTQTERFGEKGGTRTNNDMVHKELEIYCARCEEGHKLLSTAMKKNSFSNRVHDRLLKIARTIADLAGVEKITPEHIAEAINYRQLETSHSFDI